MIVTKRIPIEMWRESAVLLAVALFGGAVGGVVVGLAEAQARVGEVWIGGHAYSFESESLFGSQSDLSYLYRGVTFTFHLWCSTGPDVGIVCGNASEPSGAHYAYSFSDGGGPPTFVPAPWQIWTAPDGHEALQYETGGHVRLLVAL